MQFQELREAVCEANLALVRHGLVTCTWGNVSGIDRDAGVVAIKPSGVSYDQLRPDNMVLLNLEGGIRGADALRPSSDTATHLILYQAFPTIGGIAHTHSSAATAFAQACRSLPCLGTTHADHFHGDVPVTRLLTEQEVNGDYEVNTGHLIAETFAGRKAADIPAVLVANHGPFTWGKSCHEAVTNSLVLEVCARMALDTLALRPGQPAVAEYLLNRHFLRKHGGAAYYGQPGTADHS